MTVRIQLCGPLLVSIDGKRVEERLPGRQGRMLLGLLASERARALTRDRAIQALWSERPPSSAPAAFSAILSKLRSTLAPIEIEGRSELRLRVPAGTVIDRELARESLHRAQSAVAAERWIDAWAPARAALHTANREFLLGLEAPWIEERRRELGELRIGALECVARAAIALGGPELSAAGRAGRELIAAAPYRESGYCLLMEALERSGDVAEALRVHDRLRSRLREELGIAPSAPAQRLHERLLDQRSA